MRHEAGVFTNLRTCSTERVRGGEGTAATLPITREKCSGRNLNLAFLVGEHHRR
jgi:hypothetical protein